MLPILGIEVRGVIGNKELLVQILRVKGADAGDASWKAGSHDDILRPATRQASCADPKATLKRSHQSTTDVRPERSTPDGMT
jgi:hypothetical protein